MQNPGHAPAHSPAVPACRRPRRGIQRAATCAAVRPAVSPTVPRVPGARRPPCPQCAILHETSAHVSEELSEKNACERQGGNSVTRRVSRHKQGCDGTDPSWTLWGRASGPRLRGTEGHPAWRGESSFRGQRHLRPDPGGVGAGMRLRGVTGATRASRTPAGSPFSSLGGSFLILPTVYVHFDTFVF